MVDNKKYYPVIGDRLQTVETQIREFEAVIYRNDLEVRIATEAGIEAERVSAEADFNNNSIRKKLDVLYKVRDELSKELGVES